jgi:hypothetical protein
MVVGICAFYNCDTGDLDAVVRIYTAQALILFTASAERQKH